MNYDRAWEIAQETARKHVELSFKDVNCKDAKIEYQRILSLEYRAMTIAPRYTCCYCKCCR